MIFLASPYSDPNPEVRQSRFEAVAKCAAKLRANGLRVFSPICHSHPIAVAGDLPLDYSYWKELSDWGLRNCDKFWVLTLVGWQRSNGIDSELKIAAALLSAGLVKEIRYVDPKETNP